MRARNLRARHLADENPDAPVRVAYAIPRRVGSAVARNRIRRRIRGALDRSAQSGRPLPAGATLFLVDRPCAALDSVELRCQVDEVIGALIEGDGS